MNCNTECGCESAVVMLVFIPGIMGTRLKNKKSGDSVWDPAAGADPHESSVMATARQARENEMTQAQSLESDTAWESVGKWYSRNIHLKTSLLQGLAYVTEPIPQLVRKLWVLPTLSDLLFAGPEERKILISNDKQEKAYGRQDDLLAVDEGSEKYFKMYTSIPWQQIKEKQTRGWGTVLWGSYGEYLQYLQRQESLFKKGHINWSFPVYAIGYNWMLSNEAAGEHIKNKINDFKEDIIVNHPQGITKKQIKVILITHSMGGFAARAAVKLSGIEDEIAYVIHGAMPTDGSPQTYQQFRAGAAGAAKVILGKNAADITAVLGFCQGGLELLPNTAYTTVNKETDWLYYNDGTDENGNASENKKLPVNCGKGIYNFYQQTHRWYSMVQPELLAPEMNPNEMNADSLQPYLKDYSERIKACEVYHEKLAKAGNYHKNTIVYYSNSDKNKSYDRCVWHSNGYLQDKDINKLIPVDNENNSWFFGNGTMSLVASPENEKKYGEIKEKQTDAGLRGERPPPMTVDVVNYTLGEPLVAGDGTVHKGAGEKIGGIDVDIDETHQDFYNSSEVRAHVSATIIQFLPVIHEKLKG